MKRLPWPLAVALLTVAVRIDGTSAFLSDRPPTPANRAQTHGAAGEPAVAQLMPASHSEASQPQLRSLSPYAIQSMIEANPQTNVEDIWQRFHIADTFNGTSPYRTSQYDKDRRFFTACQDCTAAMYHYDLDGEPGPEVVLRVADNFPEACRYLIFKAVNFNDEWRLLGHIDHDFGRYRMPQHFFLLSGDKSWLGVEVQEVSGSGVSLYHHRLFTVDRRGIKEMLRYPSEGHQSGTSDQPSREFSGRIINLKIKHGVVTATVELAVSYRINLNKKWSHKWSKKQRATYKRHVNSQKVVLDHSRSTLSANELVAVYSTDSLSEEDFLKYNFTELVKIARQPQGKAWLRNFLEGCGWCGRPQEGNTLRRMVAE